MRCCWGVFVGRGNRSGHLGQDDFAFSPSPTLPLTHLHNNLACLSVPLGHGLQEASFFLPFFFPFSGPN